MTNRLLSFYEVADQAADEETLSVSTVAARPQAVDRNLNLPCDHDLALNLSQGIAKLQDAMDAASKAGLIIDPTFKSINGRFNEFGVSIDSYICHVELYRKLS